LIDKPVFVVFQSYTMRNSILGVLGEMISHVLSGEELDSKQKSTRDQFLDKLEVLVFFGINSLFSYLYG